MSDEPRETSDPTLLLIEDDPVEAAQLERMLCDGAASRWSIERAEHRSEALEKLETGEVDVVLLDLGLAGGQGLTTLQAVLDAAPQTPVVILAAADDDIVSEAALHLGARESLHKDRVGGELLGATLRHVKEQQWLLDELERARTRMAQTDRLASVGVLARGVIHELNNPLTITTLNIESAIDELDDMLGTGNLDSSSVLDEARELLVDALAGARRMGKLVTQLEAFSKADEEDSGPVSINQTVESAIDLVAGTIRHRAELVTDLGELPLLDANKGRLAQVVIALLLNAVEAIDGKAGEKEHEVIRVSTRDEGAHVVIEVEDTGGGVESERSAPVGLSICRRVVDEMHGTIDVVSGVGEGTTIAVRLPVVEPSLQKSAAVEPARPAGQGEAARRPNEGEGRPRVLIIDDQEGIGLAIRRILREEYDITVETSGEAALTTIEHDEPYDAIVSDVFMPGMNAQEIYERATAIRPDLGKRFLFMSGESHDGGASGFLEGTDRPVLRKPMKPADLREALRVIVDDQGS